MSAPAQKARPWPVSTMARTSASAAARMERILLRWAGWLKDRPETRAYLERPAGAHARAASRTDAPGEEDHGV